MSGETGRRGGLARQRDFRLLWIGDTVSQFGTQVSILAMPLIAVLSLKAGPQAVGVLVALQFTAFLVVGLPAGAWCDRWRRRPVMITADLARFALLASVPAAAWAGLLTVWQLFAVVLLQGVATVFFDVGYQSYLPSLVGPERLIEGNAKLQGSAAVAQVSGPALAGYLIQALTAPTAILVDALSFLFSAVSVGAIRRPEPVPVRQQDTRLRREIAEGVGVVFRHPVLRSLAAATSAANFFMAAFTAVIMVFLARELRLSAGTIGLLLSLGSLGGLAGALATSALTRRLGHARSAWVPLVVGSPLGLLIPTAGHGGRLVLFVAGWFAFSFAFTAYNIAGVSLRQTLCPPELLGRMNATVRFLVLGVMPFGALLGGALDSWAGPRSTLWVTQIGQLLVPVLLLASPLRSLRDASEPGGLSPLHPEAPDVGDVGSADQVGRAS